MKEKTLIDDFSRSGNFDPSDPDSPYFWSTVGSFVGDQADITQGDGFILLGSDPYTKSVAQDQPLASPLDHVKHLTYRKEKFVAAADEMIIYTLDIQAWIHGVENHPFGNEAVTDAAKDLRLASVAMATVDFDTLIIADYFITQECIYPFWERLAVSQGDPVLGNYRAFSSSGPCIARKNGDRHELTIIYDRRNQSYHWLVEGEEVFRTTDPIGYIPTNATVLIDHGGKNTEVDPDGFSAGFASFSLLDARDPVRPGALGLVKLNAESGLASDGGLYDVPQSFVDPDSGENSRLFGQGTVSKIFKYEVQIKKSE